MRKAINENPVVQISVIGVLVVVAGLFLMMNMKKSDSGSSNTSTTEASLSTPSGDVNLSVTPSSGSSAATAPTAVPSTGSGTVTPESLIPGPGLPAKLISAWDSGDAVVLLIVRGGGIDDRLVRDSVELLSSDRGISVFVARAKDVARYSRITQGLGVNRVPALVVVRPQQVSGSVPEGQVSYGFRNAQSVAQAVHDALYTGRDDLPYSPG